MPEKELTERESLLIIQQMINRARNEFVDTGIGPILWGVVITLCSIVQYLQLQFNFQLPFDIWMLAVVAVVPQIFISVKEKRMRKAKGWDDDIMSYVWLCFGAGVFLISFINAVASDQVNTLLNDYREITGKADIPHFMTFGTSYLMFVYGYPTIVTGAARKFRIMTIGGIFCWLAALVSAFTVIKFDFLLMAASATLAWLIPGIVLRKKYLLQKQQDNV
ncbi:MAG: hypothetical protein QM725_16915 [Lacibacter sp.]